MHPAMLNWFRAHACGTGGDCGSSFGGPGRHHHPGFGGQGGSGWGWSDGPSGGGGDEFGGGFGVRRPLRFLAYKLELDESQVTELATILNELKTERAQAAVDLRRTTSALADSVSGEGFDESKANAAASERVKSTERTQTAVVRALGRIHALIRPEQRGKLAYLLRTGALSM